MNSVDITRTIRHNDGMDQTNPTASAIQRADGMWLPTLNDDTLPTNFTTKDAATYAARQRLHAWWHRSDAIADASVSMTTCKECKS